VSNPFRAIACAIHPTERGGELILSNELKKTNIRQELIAYLGGVWILQCWGEILYKIGKVTQNLQGSTEVSELTLPEKSVFLGSGLGALDSITHKAKAFTPMPTVIKYNHMTILIRCFPLALMHKHISPRQKHQVISYNVYVYLISYNAFLATFFCLWQIKDDHNGWHQEDLLFTLQPMDIL